MIAVRMEHETAPCSVFIGDRAEFDRLIAQFGLADKFKLTIWTKVRLDEGGSNVFVIAPTNEVIISKKAFLIWKQKDRRPQPKATVLRGTTQLTHWLTTLRQQGRL